MSGHRILGFTLNMKMVRNSDEAMSKNGLVLSALYCS